MEIGERGASDRLLDVSRVPAGDLSREQTLTLLDDFFMANPETMIRPFPRYFELYLRRGLGKNTAQEALRRFTERDLRVEDRQEHRVTRYHQRNGVWTVGSE